jgi:hypothetical protein
VTAYRFLQKKTTLSNGLLFIFKNRQLSFLVLWMYSTIFHWQIIVRCKYQHLMYWYSLVQLLMPSSHMFSYCCIMRVELFSQFDFTWNSELTLVIKPATVLSFRHTRMNILFLKKTSLLVTVTKPSKCLAHTLVVNIQHAEGCFSSLLIFSQKMRS